MEGFVQVVKAVWYATVALTQSEDWAAGTFSCFYGRNAEFADSVA
jgi:hypothetical protein